MSRARYLSSPLAKRGKGDAARVLFENAAQDKSTVTEKDEFWPLGGMIDIMGNKEKQSLTQELIKLASIVMENLSISGNMDHIMLSFFRLVAEQKIPLDNISLHLWTEVVKWFSCSKTCSIRYSEEPKKFWELG